MTYSIVAEGLVKRFGTTRALDGIDLEVPTGTISGLLGPNGTGKLVTELRHLLLAEVRDTLLRRSSAGHRPTASPTGAPHRASGAGPPLIRRDGPQTAGFGAGGQAAA
jgi:hypothetical protein